MANPWTAHHTGMASPVPLMKMAISKAASDEFTVVSGDVDTSEGSEEGDEAMEGSSDASETLGSHSSLDSEEEEEGDEAGSEDDGFIKHSEEEDISDDSSDSGGGEDQVEEGDEAASEDGAASSAESSEVEADSDEAPIASAGAERKPEKVTVTGRHAAHGNDVAASLRIAGKAMKLSGDDGKRRRRAPSGP